MRLRIMVCSLISLISISLLHAAPTLTTANPLAMQPGKVTRVVLTGQAFQAPLRVWTSCEAQIAVVSVDPTQATLDVTLPADAKLGSVGLWIATADGPTDPISMLVDDLASVADNGANHQKDQAQSITPSCAIDGTSDGPQSDFYRFHATANQRIAFEILAQRIGSTMDSVMRLLDANGNPILLADDDTCPDSRFAHQFSQDGDYFIEVFDSRFASGGRYRLRVGDFPIVDATLPLAAQLGTQITASFVGQDASLVAPQTVTVPAESGLDSMTVAAKLPNGLAASWGLILLRGFPQVTDEHPAANASPVAVPVGMSGRLLKPAEKDSFTVSATKGQAIRFTAKTRSIGLPTMLQMQLFNAAGNKVGETPVNDADEWSFDFTIPEDGNYRLDVSDLLHRGGPAFGYYAEATLIPKYSVSLKADAKTREGFAIELSQGAAPIDVQVTRAGYDGPIEMAFAKPIAGLEILNPRIEAKVNESRIFISVNDQWTAEKFADVKLIAKAVDLADQKVAVSSVGLRRVKAPHVPFPPGWMDGLIAVAAIPAGAEFFKLEPPSPIYFAKQQTAHTATLALKRTQEAFKDAVSVLAFRQPANWTTASKPDKDNYAITWTRTGDAGQPDQVQLQTYAEFAGKGRIQLHLVPVAWIDPLKVTVKPLTAFVAGKPQRVQVALDWSDKATPQASKLTLQNLPEGVTSVPVDVAADQHSATMEVALPANFAANGLNFSVGVTTQFSGQPLTITSEPTIIPILSPPTKLEVFPTNIQLASSNDLRHLVVTGMDATGNQRDWTHDCQITSANPAIAKVEGNRVLPVADGATELTIEVGTVRQMIPVQVTNATQPRRTQFENEVLVALSKQTCNSGACHGSPSGKGGFRLSLRAFDQQLDQLTLVREEFGRRVNPLEPEKSLLLEKPLMKVAHGGGMQIHKHDPAYEILRNWIAEGATIDPPNTARCLKLEIFPNSKVILNRAYAPKQQMIAIAHYADGTTRDMTHLVAYETSNTSVAEVNARGLVTSRGRGEAAILVRYLEHIESVPMMFIEDVPGFAWQAPPANNYIDDLVNAKLKQLQYLPSETANDSEFLRRVHLDVIGLLPTIEETEAFLKDTATDKRSNLIDALLKRPEHAKFWALKWGDLLRMTTKSVGDEGVYKYNRWVEESLRENKPYDEFARELITASGSTLANPASNFYRTAADTNDCVETISQVFLGARLQCAKCHNHPFERWTQDNYYGLGAFFQRVQRKKTQRTGEMFVWTSNAGEVTQPRTGQVMKPWLPQIGSIEPATDDDRRKAFAEWLVSPTNPYFARIEANRIWSQLFAKGIVDPIDDFRDSNPPSNGPLLDALAKDFVEHKFDRQHLLRVILNSRTYQASYQTNDFNRDDARYFSHQEPRLLTAEQLLDAVNATSGTNQTFGQLPPGTKATQLPAPDVVKVDFLKVFGQPERATVCACERTEDSNLAMAIELFNGPMIYERLKDPNNRFRKVLAAGGTTEDAIKQLYLAALCRLPTDAEMASAMAHAKTRPDPAIALEDICWALLNTDEFLFQH
jgi:Protein of unknown function (DUF1549)/Protein of unknown function (DUF1553)